MKNTRWLLLLVALVMLPALASAQWTETYVVEDNLVQQYTYGMVPGDLDGDADADVFVSSIWTVGPTNWYENTDGIGGAFAQNLLSAQGEVEGTILQPYVVDMDGDGDNDVLANPASSGQPPVVWFENTAGDGSAWTPHSVIATLSGSLFAYSPVDMDGDGDIDVVACTSSNEWVSWWENDAGTGLTWTHHFIYTSVSHRSVTVGDFDGDGDQDVASNGGGASVDLRVYLNTSGDGSTWSMTEYQSGYPNPSSIRSTDLDGDGDNDLVISSTNAGNDFHWYENSDGSGTNWIQQVVIASHNAIDEIEVQDMDGDGDVDIITAQKNDGLVTWVENTAGDASAWTEHTISTTLIAPWYVELADMDGNGTMDVLSVDVNNTKVSWFANSMIPGPDYISLSGTVTNSSAVSEGVKAGLNSGLTDGYDVGYDIPKPAPPASDYLDVYFPHSGWAGDLFGNRWAVDVRDADADLVAGVHIYELTSATDQLGEDVTLTFALDAEYPAEHPVILHDTVGDVYQDLRANNVYTYTDAGSRTLNLRVGDLTDPDIAFTSPLDGDDLIATSTHTITFTYTDISAAESHILEYSVDGQATWTAITTLNDGDLDHDWAVPNVFTTDARLRLTSLDVAGNDSTIVSGSFSIAPNTMSTDVVTGFQMVSPPLIAADESNDAVFGDDLTGTYFVWDWDPATDYVLTESTTLGKGYWLASDEATTVDIDGDAELDSSTTALAAGWNMVGSGMVPQIAKTDLYINDGVTWNSFDDAVTAGWISTALYGYETGTSSYALDDSLDAFDGYWLYALTTGLTMSAYPTPSGEFTELDDFDPDMGWLLPIALQMGDVSDQVAGIGVHLNATDTFDAAYDLPVAPLPPAGTFIRAMFDHNDWDSPAGRWYAQDVRGELADDEELSYTFLIQSNDTGAFTLSFGDELPEGLDDDISITAIIDGNAYDLREQRDFALNYDGSYIYVDVIINGALDVEPVSNTGLPMAYELAPAHPNPFNPTTTLAVSLPNPGELNVTVYNITGQQVATLVNGTRAAGVHHVLLDGARLTSGVYFVHAIVPGELNQVRKVVLMK